ncbi:hypothetical protein QT979_13680 [Microcoleus sp. w2-18bC1]|uniref:hypothetical protein n=1 Tax=unclassified Microcoleus TaxID=2642155 RepID=UPI002FD13DFC
MSPHLPSPSYISYVGLSTGASKVADSDKSTLAGCDRSSAISLTSSRFFSNCWSNLLLASVKLALASLAGVLAASVLPPGRSPALQA